jgi:DNA-binding MarR family transcriptional regulator
MSRRRATESDPASSSPHQAFETSARQRVRDRLSERGHALGPASTQVFPNLPREGLGMTELAARLRITLQRTGQLVQQLEEAGYVERVPDEKDGRAKRVVYSRKGRRLLADIDEAMDELAAVVGKRRFDQLCGTLKELDRALNGEDAPLRLFGG